MALPLRMSGKQPQPDDKEHSVSENIRNRQDHIEFLENYISEINIKIDELTGGRDLEKEIASMAFRIEVLGGADGKYPERLTELKAHLAALQKKYNEIKPQLDKLSDERAYYRHVQSKL
jgi:chromosome segregation ATPase